MIRDLKAKDRGDIIDNYYEFYKEVRRNPYLGLNLFRKKPTMKFEKKWFGDQIKKIKKGDVIFLVAEVGGRVVGACDVERGNSEVTDFRGEVGIAIKDGYRSMGIGKALILEIIRRSRGTYRMLTLTVFGTNKPALGLYKKAGFKKYGRLPGGMVRGNRHIDLVYMYRKV